MDECAARSAGERMTPIAWYCLGALSAFVYVAVLNWIATRVGRASDQYDATVPLTRTEYAARRERATANLIAAVGQRPTSGAR